MYGEDGWCRSCGVPKGPQVGSLVLRSKGFKTSAGAWVPNWRYDAVCLGSDLSDEVAERFPSVSLMPVEWRNGQLGRATQILPTLGGEPWFDAEELRKRLVAVHGSAGAECGSCGVWRWYPLVWGQHARALPPLRARIPDEVEVAASPEWFGDGCLAFRALVFRRPLAETIAQASPRNVEVRSLP
jgi:hypothetical protein